MNKNLILKQSRNWWQSKPLNWFVENALFAFTNNGYKGNRVRIVTKMPNENGMNCFEFDNDRYGIIITSESEFGGNLAQDILVKDTDVLRLLCKFLERLGAGEFINPKNVRLKRAFNKKDKYIEFNYNLR